MKYVLCLRTDYGQLLWRTVHGWHPRFENAIRYPDRWAAVDARAALPKSIRFSVDILDE